MIDEIFKNVKADFGKLLEYGFIKKENNYVYNILIINGQFDLTISISEKGDIKTELIDVATFETYVLHLIKSASGEFVGRVRSEVEKVLTDIKDKCFTSCIYKSKQAQLIINYIREKYNDELEFLWSKSDTAIWRRKDNNKWYGTLQKVIGRKLGLNIESHVEILNLKLDTAHILAKLDDKKYFKGYHMNKKYWCSILLKDDNDTSEIFKLIDESYLLSGRGNQTKKNCV